MSTPDDKQITAKLVIPFKCEKHSTIAYNSLRVDPEPSRGNCIKTLDVDKNNLIINIKADQLKQLRVSVNNILELLLLVIETISRFEI